MFTLALMALLAQDPPPGKLVLICRDVDEARGWKARGAAVEVVTDRPVTSAPEGILVVVDPSRDRELCDVPADLVLRVRKRPDRLEFDECTALEIRTADFTVDELRELAARRTVTRLVLTDTKYAAEDLRALESDGLHLDIRTDAYREGLPTGSRVVVRLAQPADPGSFAKVEVVNDSLDVATLHGLGAGRTLVTGGGRYSVHDLRKTLQGGAAIRFMSSRYRVSDLKAMARVGHGRILVDVDGYRAPDIKLILDAGIDVRMSTSRPARELRAILERGRYGDRFPDFGDDVPDFGAAVPDFGDDVPDFGP